MKAPRCPSHLVAMRLEDIDRAYGQELWLCPDRSCGEAVRRGESDVSIYRREQVA